MLSAGRLSGRRATALAAAAAATALVLAPLAGAASAAPAVATTTGATSPELTIAAVDPLVSEGESLEVEIVLDNPTDAIVPATSVDVLLTAAPIPTRYGLTRWFAGQSLLASSVIATVEVPAAPARLRATASATIDAAALGLDGRSWGAYGLAANGGDLATATSIVVRDEPGEASPTRLSLVAPIDAGASDGLLDAAALEAATTIGGDARESLDAAIAAGLSYGIDPVFAASEAALGDEAPEAATSWLDRADRPEAYALEYANADPIAEVRAGVHPVELLGVPREDAPMLPPGAADVGTAAPVIDATSAVLRQDDLASLAGIGTVVLTTAGLDEVLVGSTPSAHVAIDGVEALAADAELQSLVREAVLEDGLAAADARARTLALLATITRERPSDSRALAAMLPASSLGDSGPLLSDLGDAGFVDTVEVDEALRGEPREASLAELDDPARGAGAELVTAALAQEAEVSSVSSIVEDPSALLADLRLQLLGALPDAGRAVTEADRIAIDGLGGAMGEVRHAVQILGGSDIQAVGQSLPLPITITNELDEPVTVQLSVRPSNALVTVPDPEVDVTIPASSQQRVQVPIEIVGTGGVLMIAQLSTPDGVSLGQLQTIRVQARPTIEAVVGWTLGSAIALLLGFGIWRSVRKRRRGEARGDLDDRPLRGRPQTTGTEETA